MPDIEDALKYALAQIGKPYSTGSHRFGETYFDCSGLVIRSLVEAGIKTPNGIGIGSGNSVSLYNWAKSVGGLVSVEKAIHTRGAILIRGRWYGYGPMGDVKFSLGNGLQTGAGSRRTGVATRSVFTNFFHDGFIIPGVNYSAVSAPSTPQFQQEQTMIQQRNHYDRHGKPVPISDRNKAGQYVAATVAPSFDGKGVDLDGGASLRGDQATGVPGHRRLVPSDLGSARIVAVANWVPRDGTVPGVILRYSDGRTRPVRFS